jgi:hypothetical protein
MHGDVPFKEDGGVVSASNIIGGRKNRKFINELYRHENKLEWKVK